MHNPIYQSIGGRIQCTMEGGVLFARDWVGDAKSQWHPVHKTEAELLEDWQTESERPGGTVDSEYRAGCLYSCFTDLQPSRWRMEPESEKLAREIEDLMRERDLALAAEMADRPQVVARA